MSDKTLNNERLKKSMHTVMAKKRETVVKSTVTVSRFFGHNCKICGVTITLYF